MLPPDVEEWLRGNLPGGHAPWLSDEPLWRELGGLGIDPSSELGYIST